MGHNFPVSPDLIIRTLRDHEAELKAAGILHLRLFGSAARNQASPDSDVDLMAEFDSTRRLTLLHMVRMENQLSDLLGAKVDLARFDSMKEPVRRRALREAIHAF
jgi:uncharacterized protein